MDKLRERIIKRIKKSGKSIEFDNTFPLRWCSGVSDDSSVFNFKKFNIDTNTVNTEHMCFLLGYKKIAWCQECNKPFIKKIKEIISEYDQFHNEYKDNYTDINLKSRIIDLCSDTSLDKYKQIMNDFPENISMKEHGDDVFFYYVEYEDTVDKLIEIIKSGDVGIYRNEAAIGLLLGYSSENVKGWIDTHDNKNKMWGELLGKDEKDVTDKSIEVFLAKISSHKSTERGLLSGIEIPTTTKYKLFDNPQYGGQIKNYKNKYLNYKNKYFSLKYKML